MNANEIVTILQIQKGLQIVGVRYVRKYDGGEYKEGHQSKLFYYKAAPDHIIKKDDYVVVYVGNQLTTAKVEEIFTTIPEDFDFSKQYSYVIGVIDTSLSDQLTQEEKATIEHIKKAELLERVAKIQQNTGFDFTKIDMPILENKVIN